MAYALTTAVSGQVVTPPARAADSTKGSVISTARARASIDSADLRLPDTADGSCSLDGVEHSGRSRVFKGGVLERIYTEVIFGIVSAAAGDQSTKKAAEDAGTAETRRT